MRSPSERYFRRNGQNGRRALQAHDAGAAHENCLLDVRDGASHHRVFAASQTDTPSRCLIRPDGSSAAVIIRIRLILRCKIIQLVPLTTSRSINTIGRNVPRLSDYRNKLEARRFTRSMSFESGSSPSHFSCTARPERLGVRIGWEGSEAGGR